LKCEQGGEAALLLEGTGMNVTFYDLLSMYIASGVVFSQYVLQVSGFRDFNGLRVMVMTKRTGRRERGDEEDKDDKEDELDE
jgi:hypothetical protein